MAADIKRRRGYTHLSGRHQVTIPMEIMTARGWQPGQAFRVELRDGDLVLVPDEDLRARRRRVLREMEGEFRGMYPPGYLDELRDQWG